MAILDLAKHRLDRFITELPDFPSLTADAQLDETNPEVEANVVLLEPNSLDDLKTWIGIPNDAIDHQRHGVQLRPVASAHLPNEPFVFSELAAESQEAVVALAHNLLFGYADPNEIRQGPAAHVVRHLLATNRQLRALVGKDLVVQDGQTVTLTTTPNVFDTITVYGTGTIQMVCDVKVITDSLTYVAD